MTWPWIACTIGLALGLVMGLAMLLRPRGSHLSIGLGSIPEKSGGVGESRAFGGFLLGLHGFALANILGLVQVSVPVDLHGAWMVVSHPMVSLLAVGWLCAFLGRALSMALDREGMALNTRLLALDAAMTLLIALPLLVQP